MGHNPEAKSENIPSLQTLRIQQVRGLIAQADRELNEMALPKDLSGGLYDRGSLNTLVQQEKFDYAVNFLSQRSQGFANHHTKNTVLRSLLLASIRNTEQPQVVGILKHAPSEHIVFDREYLRVEELEADDVLQGHNSGVQAALHLLSEGSTGLLTRVPDPKSSIFTDVLRKKNGMTILQAPTKVFGIDVNYSVMTTPQLEVVSVPQIWFDVHHLQAA